MLLIIVTGIALGVLIGGFLLYLAINAFKRYDLDITKQPRSQELGARGAKTPTHIPDFSQIALMWDNVSTIQISISLLTNRNGA